jgi:hypothetical protein
MSSQDKNLNKEKSIFKQGSNLLSRINNYQQQNSLNIFSNFKKINNVNFPNINSKINKLVPFMHSKQNSDVTGINSVSEISKTYSLSKPKNENNLNKIANSKYKLSKIVASELSSNIRTSRILDTYSNAKTTSKTSQNNSIKIEINNTSDNKGNLNNLKKSNVINASNSNNNILNLKINKKIINEKISSSNDSFYDKIIKELSAANNSNGNMGKKRETIGHIHIKTDINDIYKNSPKDKNMKLIFENKNSLEKKMEINTQNSYIMGTPYNFLKVNNQIALPNTTPEIKLKCSLDKNNKLLQKEANSNKNNNRILTIKPNKNEHIILESIPHVYDSKTIKTKFTLDSIETNQEYLKENKKGYKCPEELHFYYITVLQEGKKNENSFEGE